MNCEVDYCGEDGSQTLTVETDDRVIELRFCPPHARALSARIAEQLGALPHHVNLYAGQIPGTIKDIQDAIDYLDSTAATGRPM